MRGGGSHTLISANPIILSTESERENLLAPINDKLYFILEDSKLYLYNSGNWFTLTYSHPSYSSHKSGFYKLSVDGFGHVNGATAVSKEDIIDLGIIDIDLNGSNNGDVNLNNADSLGGILANEYVLKNDLLEKTNKVIYNSSRNLLINTAKSQTINGVTFTVNKDGSVTANGTATANAFFSIVKNYTTPNGECILSGCPVGGSTSTFRFYAVTADDVYFMDYGDGITIPSGSLTFTNVTVMIFAGYTANNLTFYPMIRLASETDDTYEPYYEGLKDLTDRGMKLLWENASPSSEFGEQTIVLDLSNYDEVEIRFNYNDDVHSITNVLRCKVGERVMGVTNNSSKYFKRPTYTSTKNIQFLDTSSYAWDTSTETISNSMLIPTYIYGIKGVST